MAQIEPEEIQTQAKAVAGQVQMQVLALEAVALEQTQMQAVVLEQAQM
jgi:hypothetical protein